MQPPASDQDLAKERKAMAKPSIHKEALRQHALIGRKQSPEHIARRVASVAATKAAWSEEQRREAAKNAGLSSRAREKVVYRGNSPLFPKGHVPWNKGNRWTDKFSPEEIRAKTAERARRRRATNPRTKLHGRISCLVRNTLKERGISKDTVSWPTILGYSLDELEPHLRATLPEGYDWNDYLDGALQLDHIVPVSAHNFTSIDDLDFRRCWALTNLRLIPKEENQRKRATLLKPFQPSLALRTL